MSAYDRLLPLGSSCNLCSGGEPMALMDEDEHAVPELWRPKLKEIAAAFAEGDFQLYNTRIEGVEPVDLDTAHLIAANIAAYGARLTSLHEATWDRSIYRWMGTYWQVLVDLSTDEEPVSDLTLHAKVYKADCSHLKIDSVHVP